MSLYLQKTRFNTTDKYQIKSDDRIHKIEKKYS